MANHVAPTPKLPSKLLSEYEALVTTSARIRFLHANNYSRGDIARITGKRYQHVRNVLITPLKNG